MIFVSKWILRITFNLCLLLCTVVLCAQVKLVAESDIEAYETYNRGVFDQRQGNIFEAIKLYEVSLVSYSYVSSVLTLATF